MSKLITSFQDQWQQKSLTLCYDLVLFLYLETVLHWSVFSGFDRTFLLPLLFSAMAGFAVFLLTSLLPEKANRVFHVIAVTFADAYYLVQFIYHCVFGSFMPVSQLALGTDAVTNFFPQILYAVRTNLLSVILLILPLAVNLLLQITGKIAAKPLRLAQLPIALGCWFVVIASTMALLMSNTTPGSAYQLFNSVNASTEACFEKLGLWATTIQESRRILLPDDSDIQLVGSSIGGHGTSGSERNQLDLDFAALAQSTENEIHKQIDAYLATVTASSKNEYTGIAEGYNLITICAESFSPLVIDPELTPTLYKLSTNGFVFSNFYTSFPNTTTNGEYTFCMGLMPNMSRNKLESSFNASANNYLPYSLGNVYREAGQPAYAYHNYFATFYDRYITHANMGYAFRALGQGLDIPAHSPTSDLDMMNAVMPEFLQAEEPFHAYFMTYSGHYQYNWENAMSQKNRAAVENLPYSETVKAYIACNLELEYALCALMDGLEEAGIADRTVIVLTGDHYPYGLSDAEYSELAVTPVDTDFEKYRNAFICYVPGMEPVEVDAYCSTQDILPTVLNIMGIEFDSRLLAGRDVLSDAPHVAVLADQSFLTEAFRYNAATGEVVSHEGYQVSEAEVQDYRNYVENMFTLSVKILDSNYYSHVFDRSSENTQQILTFTDITSIYMESSVTYMVTHGYMDPISDTEFGANTNGTVAECIQVLHKFSGADGDALAWALDAGILSDAGLWEQDVTFRDAAAIFYRFALANNIIADNDSPKELERHSQENPDLSAEEITSRLWCIDAGIMLGTENDAPFGESYLMSINRARLATYLHRLMQLCLPV